jgi:hypothetical protein
MKVFGVNDRDFPVYGAVIGHPQPNVFGALAHLVQRAVNEMLDQFLAEPLSDAIRGYDVDRGGFHVELFLGIVGFHPNA